MTGYQIYRTQSAPLARLAGWMEEAEERFMSDEHGEWKVFACFLAMALAGWTLLSVIAEVLNKFGLLG